VYVDGARICLRNAATNGPIVLPPDNNIWVCSPGKMMILTRENRRTGEKPVPVPLCAPQIPHGLVWTRLCFLLTVRETKRARFSCPNKMVALYKCTSLCMESALISVPCPDVPDIFVGTHTCHTQVLKFRSKVFYGQLYYLNFITKFHSRDKKKSLAGRQAAREPHVLQACPRRTLWRT
jgi:hypothetical protein